MWYYYGLWFLTNTELDWLEIVSFTTFTKFSISSLFTDPDSFLESKGDIFKNVNFCQFIIQRYSVYYAWRRNIDSLTGWVFKIKKKKKQSKVMCYVISLFNYLFISTFVRINWRTERDKTLSLLKFKKSIYKSLLRELLVIYCVYFFLFGFLFCLH